MTDNQLQRLLALDGGPGPALAIDAAHADAIIDAALAGAGFGPGGGGGASPARPAAGGAKGGMAVGTKLAIVGGTALIVVIALLAWRRGHGGEHVVAVIPDAAVIDAPSGGSGEAVAIASADAPPLEPTVPTVPAEPAPPVEPTEPATRAPHREATARATADLLGEANAKRAAKQWRTSDVLYARVVDRAPKSLAAQTALVASAQLHLEHFSDPRGAAQRFRRALAIAPGGALAEDARWGLAEAARASHDTRAESAALDDFLSHHPKSPLAPRARARRAELP